MPLRPSTIADWRSRQGAAALLAVGTGIAAIVSLPLMWLFGESFRLVWAVCTLFSFVFSGVSFLCFRRVETMRRRHYDEEQP